MLVGVEEATTKFKPSPVALAVAVDQDLATECEAILELLVVPVAAVADALQKMVVLRPLVVLAGSVPLAELEELRARCLDTASELVTVPVKNGRLELELKAALRAARIQRKKT
jgi:hypothetical protein